LLKVAEVSVARSRKAIRHTRGGPHADARCRTESPALEAVGDGVSVACWHWRTIAPPASTRARATRPDDALARLQAAFVR
jgi:hypothetical protein